MANVQSGKMIDGLDIGTMQTIVIGEVLAMSVDEALEYFDGEAGVNIAKAIRPAQLSREIYSYLSPRRKVSYYFDAGVPENKGSGR